MAIRTTVPVRDASSPIATFANRRSVRVLRWLVGAVFVARFVVSYNRNGFPFDRERVFLWIAAALFITLIGRPWRRWVEVVVDWFPFALAFFIYDYSRGIATWVGRPVTVKGLLQVEKTLFFGKVPSVWIQTGVAKTGTSVGWWELGVSIVYASHFVLPFVVAGVLWWRSRREFHAWIARLMTLAFAGIAVYILVPAAPPWFAADEGLIPALTRPAGRGWSKIHLYAAPELLKRGQSAANPFAALPSLHAGIAFLIALHLFRRIGRGPWRWLLFLYPLAMAFALVYGAEHYVVDIFLGCAMAWLADAFYERGWHRSLLRRLRGRSRPSTEGAPASRETMGSGGASPR
jgi:hypothetical protein